MNNSGRISSPYFPFANALFDIRRERVSHVHLIELWKSIQNFLLIAWWAVAEICLIDTCDLANVTGVWILLTNFLLACRHSSLLTWRVRLALVEVPFLLLEINLDFTLVIQRLRFIYFLLLFFLLFVQLYRFFYFTLNFVLNFVSPID